MVAFNFFSVALFIFAIWLLRFGAYFFSTTIAMIEIMAHATVATYFLGANTGFIYYSLLLPIAVFLNPSSRHPVQICYRILFVLIPVMVFLISWDYSLANGPLYPLETWLVRALQTLNVSLVSLSLAGMGGIFTSLVNNAEDALEHELNRSESLLLNVLPPVTAERLKSGESPIADRFEETTVIFLDIAGFTEISAGRSPNEIVGILDEIFTRFDELAERFGLEKIKTIGDAYMVVAGIPVPAEDHAFRAMEMSIAMMDSLKEYNRKQPEVIRARIGLCSGPVVAGVIGRKKFIYDLWGDTVNTASRMESYGQPGRIQVTESTYSLLRDQYQFSCRGKIEVKGKGKIVTYMYDNSAAC